MNPAKYWRYQDNLQGILVLLLFFVLPFPIKFINIVLAAIILFAIIVAVRRREFPVINLHWFLPALFIYYVTSELISGGSLSDLEKRLTLLIPVLFAIIPNFNSVPGKPRVYVAYILGNLSSVFLCFVRALVRSIYNDGGQWVFNPKVIKDSDYDFLTSSVMGGNYFFGSEFSYFIHPTYFGLYIVFALYLLFEVSKSQQGKYWFVLAYFVLLITLFLLSSKAAILVSFILTFYILLNLPVPRIAKITTVVAFVAIIALFIFFNPRLKVFNNTFESSMVVDPNAKYGHALRILSWDAALDVIRDNWVFGVGEARKEKALVDVYNMKGYVFPASEKFNSHNQYLDFLLGGGIICLGLYVTGFIDLIVRSLKDSNFPLIMLLLVFSFIALFENLLSRYHGMILLSVFVSILLPGMNLSKRPVSTMEGESNGH